MASSFYSKTHSVQNRVDLKNQWLRPIARQAIITPKSINMLKKKAGTVILVGIAARLVIRTIITAIAANERESRLVPVRKIAIKVMGANTLPCKPIPAPIHIMRLRSWFSAHFIKSDTKEGAVMLLLKVVVKAWLTDDVLIFISFLLHKVDSTALSR